MAPRKDTQGQGAPTNRKRKAKNGVGSKATAGRSNAPEAVTRSEERRKGKRLMVFGENLCGQLGFNCDKRKFPALVPSLANKEFKAVACGGLHTLALEHNGNLWSFGNNDECALGRQTENDEEVEEEGEEDAETTPGLVQVPGRIISISAGDSHSAALTSSGKVYAWGVFRDKNGKFGLLPVNVPLCQATPVEITSGLSVKIIKIASGSNHIAMIGADGKVYTCGANDEGQLGRINPQRGPMRYTRNTSFIINNDNVAQVRRRQHKVFCLTPNEVKIGSGPKIGSIACGEFSTIMLSRTGKDVYVCGLNNYGQLGIINPDGMTNNIIWRPTKRNEFQGIVWQQIAAGLHHTTGLDKQGLVYSLGRNHNGRLGLGLDTPRVDSVHVPQVIDSLVGAAVVSLAAGSNTSYAITSQGMVCSWGMGIYHQLAAGDDRDRAVPGLCIGKRDRDPNGNAIDSIIDGEVLSVEGGGQHVGLIVSKFD